MENLLEILKFRFDKNISRHPELVWSKIQTKLESSPSKIESLSLMESTGGEPDVVGYDQKTGEFIFMDCSPETPAGRRSLCYDRDALNSRKAFKP